MIRKFVGAAAVVLILGSLMTGCGTMTGGGKGGATQRLSKTPEMEQSFQQAEKLFYDKKFPQAEEAYRAYLSSFPYNALTAKAYFRLGEIAFHEKDYKKAASLYKKSVERGVDSDWGGMALYKEAICYSKLEDPKKVFAALDQIPWDKIDSKIAIRSGSLRISVAKKVLDHLQEIKGYLEVLDSFEMGFPPEIRAGEQNWLIDEKTAREEVHAWISGELTEVEGGKAIGACKDWLKRFEGRISGSYLTWKLARLYHQKGDYENAALMADRYAENYPKQEYAGDARKLLAELGKRGAGTPTEGARHSVGVLLPLTGKYAVYGQSVLHGLECAAGIFAPCRGDLGVNLMLRDSHSDPKVAARIVEDFSRNSEVRAVVGPLPTSEIDGAVAIAEQAGLPMITLSQKPDVAKAGNYIFRNFLTVSDQVASLVNYACQEKRWKKFAILYPEGAAGEEYKKSFREELDHCGGKLVASASYPEGARSFTESLRSLNFSPFHALFIPDIYRRIPQIISDMKSLDMTGIHLLGGAGWNHPGILEAGADLEGAVFVDGFFAKSSNFTTRDFVTTFQAAYGFDPTLLEAYAFDTLRLLGEILRDHPTADHANLQRLIAEKGNFSGVTGAISFDEDGDARRRLILLTVDQGEIKEVQ